MGLQVVRNDQAHLSQSPSEAGPGSQPVGSSKASQRSNYWSVKTDLRPRALSYLDIFYHGSAYAEGAGALHWGEKELPRSS